MHCSWTAGWSRNEAAVFRCKCWYSSEQVAYYILIVLQFIEIYYFIRIRKLPIRGTCYSAGDIIALPCDQAPDPVFASMKYMMFLDQEAPNINFILDVWHTLNLNLTVTIMHMTSWFSCHLQATSFLWLPCIHWSWTGYFDLDANTKHFVRLRHAYITLWDSFNEC